MPDHIHPLLQKVIEDNVEQALAEDVGTGDLTAMLVDNHDLGHAKVICRQKAILCGSPWFNLCFKTLDPDINIEWLVEEGQWIEANQTVCTLKGNTRALLTGERCGLNFLQLLSATATKTKEYVNALGQNTNTKILDTRKTIPGLRQAQKYAVRIGGGTNHRIGLFDGILIKENHIASAGSVANALLQAQKVAKKAEFVQIEVETLTQLEEALNAGAKMVLLDNMPYQDIVEAVKINNKRALLEVSGSVLLDEIKTLADIGVDRISVGALTKNLKATDFSMRFESMTNGVL